MTSSGSQVEANSPACLAHGDREWLVAAPASKPLTQGVHVWRVNLGISGPVIEQQAALLDARELARARRFYFEQDRRRYIASHGALRRVLACLVGVEPASVLFDFGPHGKPRLREALASGDIRFSLAHSDNMALIAAARHADVGIDLERLRPLPDAMEIAARFFARDEVAHLSTVVGTKLESQAFFNCWTRKEAIIKALGDGLSRPLDSFAVTLLPGHTVEVSWNESLGAELTGWSLIELNPAPDFAAALAISSHGVPVSCWSFSWDD